MSPLIIIPLIIFRIYYIYHYYDLTKKTNASTGQKIIPLGAPNNDIRVIKLEKRINNQEQKLDKILELLQNGNNLPNADKQSS